MRTLNAEATSIAPKASRYRSGSTGRTTHHQRSACSASSPKVPDTAASSGNGWALRSETTTSLQRSPMSRATSTALPIPRTIPPDVRRMETQRGRRGRSGSSSAMAGREVGAAPGCLQSARKPGRRIAPRRADMRAVRIEQPGSARGLRLVEVEEPVPGPGEIQVEVHATALNRADWLQILGKYPVPAGTPADLPGMEYAGTVRAVGPRAARFRPGDRVMGIVPGAAFA